MADPATPDLASTVGGLFNGAVTAMPGALKQYGSDIESATQQQRDAYAQGLGALQGLGQGTNIPGLMWAAGMGAPTKTGSFGESMASGFGAYGGALQQQQKFDLDKLSKIQALREAGANLARQAAQDRFGLQVGTPLDMVSKIGAAVPGVSDVRYMTAPPVIAGGKGNLGVVPQGPAPSAGPMPQAPAPVSPPPAPDADMPPAPAPVSPQANSGAPMPAAQPALPPNAPASAPGVVPRDISLLQDYKANPQTYDNDPQKLAAVRDAYQRVTQATGYQPQPQIADQSLDTLTVPRARAVLQDAAANPGKYLGPAGQNALKNAQEAVKNSTQKAGEDQYAKTAAEKRAAAPYAVREAVDPNTGAKYYTTDAAVLGAGAPGSAGGQSGPGQGGPGGVMAAAPPGLGKRQDLQMEADQKTFDSYAPVVASEQRLQHLGDLLSQVQTGKWTTDKASIVASLKSMGLPVGDEFAKNNNPAVVQQMIKESMATVMDQLKAMPGQPRVAEIVALQKAMSDPDLQPEANAAVTAQTLGVVRSSKQYIEDYKDWRKTNPYTPVEQFSIQWQKDHPLDSFIKTARSNIAPKGETIPAPEQRTVGQAYMTPNGKFRWMGSGWQKVD